MQDYKGALADLDECIKLSPKESKIYFNRAIVKSYLKDYKGAVEDYNKVSELTPNNADAWLIAV